MPNNSAARRREGKKSREKKRKDSKETDTPLLSKEDTAIADSGTLSLSSAGKDKEKETAACNLEKHLQEKALVMWHKDKAKLNAGNSPSLSSKVQKEKQHTPLVQKEKWHTPLADKELAQALGKMEEAILKYDAGEAGEPDWNDADFAWAKLSLRVMHHQALGDERMNIRRNIREALREKNQLISKAELVSQSNMALTMNELEWWKGTAGGIAARNAIADGIAAGKAESSAGSTARAPPPVVIRRDEQGDASAEDQVMLDRHWRLCLRMEYSRTLTLDERTEMRRHVRIEHPGASEEESGSSTRSVLWKQLSQRTHCL